MLTLWQLAGQLDDLDSAHLRDEVLDILNPADGSCITCEDMQVSKQPLLPHLPICLQAKMAMACCLQACGMGGEVLGLLVCVTALFDWESKELQIAAA